MLFAKKPFAALLTIVMFAFSSNGNAALIRDQGQIFGTGGLLSLETSQWSQSITVGISGLLSGIQVQFNAGTPAPMSDITMAVFDGGNPLSGPALFSEVLSLSNSDLEPSDLYIWDVSSAGLTFDTGQQFSFVLQAAGTGFEVAGNDPPGYAGGGLYRDGSVFGDGSLEAPRDIGFVTFVDPTAVPIPATLALMGLGLAGLGWRRRQRA